uniref:Cytochrome b561 domain-containing protein n=1 Tax=Odontella aurita TaxID=265563 RepID=A0A7S4M4W4_9STRA
MVTGFPKIKANAKPSPMRYRLAVAFCSLFSLGGGYFAALQPSGAGWRDPFSYHPLLMMIGFVGLMGSAAVTKKLGGYTNTKNHGIMSFLGLLCAFGGLYAIYQNKEKFGKPHLNSGHSVVGLLALTGATSVGLAGAVFLHPDFGSDKQNKTIRFVHHWTGKITLIAAFFSCMLGLNQLTENPIILIGFSFPLVALVPLAVM